jgi:hypothetical protein
MADAACSRRELFGGAIVGSLPARLVDVSDFRQVCTPPSPNSTGTVRSQAAGVSRSGRASGHRSPRAPTARQDAVMEPPRSPTGQLPGRGRGFTEGSSGPCMLPHVEHTARMASHYGRLPLQVLQQLPRGQRR